MRDGDDITMFVISFALDLTRSPNGPCPPSVNRTSWMRPQSSICHRISELDVTGLRQGFIIKSGEQHDQLFGEAAM